MIGDSEPSDSCPMKKKGDPYNFNQKKSEKKNLNKRKEKRLTIEKNRGRV